MRSHPPILGRYPLTARVIDLLVALSVLALVGAVVLEVATPGGFRAWWRQPILGIAPWDVAGLAVFLGVCVLVLALLLFVLAGLVRAFVHSFRPRSAGEPARNQANLDQHEAQLMQEIHQSLGRMENRIEALETILLDRSRGRVMK